MSVIGLTGYAGSGKTTLARYLVEKHGYIEVYFSEPLKKSCSFIFGFSHDQLYGDKKEEVDSYWGVSPRRVMQIIGTELYRNELPKHEPKLKNVWIRSAIYKITSLIVQGFNVVISDIRFQNEVDLVRKEFPEMRVYCIDRFDKKTDQNTHESEQLYVIYDISIPNRTTIEDLYTKMDSFLI